MNNTFIVLIPVKNSDAREICERNNNLNFANKEEAKNFYPKNAIIQNISDFMDDFNNQDLNEDGNFMGYCTILQ